ncbi:MAG: DUF1761 domain-containing protein [Bacteroidota bacterium]|jgi:hypothetical protein
MEVHINFLAVFVAALANYIIATVWYAVIFGNLWKKLTSISDMKPSPIKMIIVFIGSLLMSYVLVHAIVFGNAYLHTSGICGGLMCGFFNWLGFIAPVTLTNVIYEKRPWKLWLLDNAFWLISLLVMGSILSVWQ